MAWARSCSRLSIGILHSKGLCRITSYNVCYTKLLRQVFSDAIKHATSIREHAERKRAMEEPCVVISPAGMLVGGNAVRITSYNVCYTKLLRRVLLHLKTLEDLLDNLDV